MKLEFTQHNNEIIIAHEDRMLDEYTHQLLKYKNLFELKGCSLRTGLMWKMFPAETTLFQRCGFQNGYECYVYCVVERDGKEVQINSTDSDADFYSLSSAWLVSSIYRAITKMEISLYSETDDVDSEMREFLMMLRQSE